MDRAPGHPAVITASTGTPPTRTAATRTRLCGPAIRFLVPTAILLGLALVTGAAPAQAGQTAAGTPGVTGAVVLGWSPTTSPGVYNYGTLHLGRVRYETFVLTNSGSSASSALTVTLTGSAAFTKTSDGCTGHTLGPAKACKVTVKYAPGTPGQTGKATLTASSGNPPATGSLTLKGAEAAKAAPAIATAPSAGGALGTAVTDTATLTGSENATGTIEFTLYGPSGSADCSGTPLFDQSVTVTGDASYTSPSYSPAAMGTYYWIASYSGDASNYPAATHCGDEAVTITRAAPSLATSASGTANWGTPQTDTATLSGGDNPTGTIEFTLYGPSATADCSGTPVFDQTVPVSGDGSYTSPSYAPYPSLYSYWWVASYSGDANNAPVATSCGQESTYVVGHAYWVGNSQIWQSWLDGSAVHAIVTGAGDARRVAVAPWTPQTVDRPTLYWTDDGNGTIWESYFDGSGVHAIVTGQNQPHGIAVNGSNLYWTDEGDGTIMEANLDGTGAHVIATGQGQATDVAVNGSNLYWANGNGQIVAANLDGTGAHTIGSGGPGVAVNATHVYWVSGDAVVEANLDGSGAHTIIAGQNPDGITVSASNLYWADGSSVWSANLDGTGVHALASGVGALGVAIGP